MELQREEISTAPLNTAAIQDDTGAQNALPQPTYRSFKYLKDNVALRKKFRKMKLKFDEAMQQNKELFFDEQRAIQTAKRLALQNDQILDMLYDVNNSAQIPVEKRIDLTTEIPSLSEIPPLVSGEELSKISELTLPEGRRLYQEICKLITVHESLNPPVASLKSLAHLITNTPHLRSSTPNLPPDLLASLEPMEGQQAPYSYLTPDQIDEFYQEIDASQGGFQSPSRPLTQEIYHDPVFGNSHSPYNWLRRFVPQIFLQDCECSEKSTIKPGVIRGAGKRANIPVPSKTDTLEIVEEDGLGYEFTLGASKEKDKKRKRDEDDCRNTPKKGTTEENKAKKPRPSRKKKGDCPEEKTSSARKSKKPKISSPLGAHPFGPA